MREYYYLIVVTFDQITFRMFYTNVFGVITFYRIEIDGYENIDVKEIGMLDKHFVNALCNQAFKEIEDTKSFWRYNEE